MPNRAALGDAQRRGDVAETYVGVIGDADQRTRVVREEAPLRHAMTHSTARFFCHEEAYRRSDHRPCPRVTLRDQHARHRENERAQHHVGWLVRRPSRHPVVPRLS